MLSSIGPFVDYYFDPHGGGHLQAAIAFGVAAQSEGKDVTNSFDGSGTSIMLGGGYEFWVGDEWGLGILGRLQYFDTTVENDSSQAEADFTALVLALMMSVTYH
jgi:hypothetical protein